MKKAKKGLKWDEDLNRKVDEAEAVAEGTPRNNNKKRSGEHNKREKEEAKKNGKSGDSGASKKVM